MRYLQRVAETVFSLTAAALVVFGTVKNTKSSGSAVFPILWGTLVASVLIWIVAEVLRRRARRRSGAGSRPVINQPVTSYDQSGGITAHRVTLPPREADDQGDSA